MTKQQTQRKKVPLPIKVAIGVIGTTFMLIAIIGSVHGQTIPQSVKGYIGADQTTAKSYPSISSITDPKTKQQQQNRIGKLEG